jgi:tRNA(Ile)-lysidine synthase TilS/MesJ
VIEQVSAALGQQKRIGIAVSGGADSVFLLTAIHQLGLAAAVLHVNHKPPSSRTALRKHGGLA